MSDNVSVIDAIKTIAKATQEDPENMVAMARGALHKEQIEAVATVFERLVIEKTPLQAAATEQASSSAAARPSWADTTLAAEGEPDRGRRAWKGNKAPASDELLQASTADTAAPSVPDTTTTWRRVDRPPSRAASRQPRRGRDITPHPLAFSSQEEVANMSPRSRARYDTEMVAIARRNELADRRRREQDKLMLELEADMVSKFRTAMAGMYGPADTAASSSTPIPCKAPPLQRPTTPRRAEATGASSSSATQEPQGLPLGPPPSPLPSGDGEGRRATIDARGSYPDIPDMASAAVRRPSRKVPRSINRHNLRVDIRGRVDKTWRRFPLADRPPGAISGPGHSVASKGAGKGVHADNARDDLLGPGPILDSYDPKRPGFDPGRYIPDVGSIVFVDGLSGRGRWDTRNEIFRCVVRCPHCRYDLCNRRMWWSLDNHPQHFFKRCQRELNLDEGDSD